MIDDRLAQNLCQLAEGKKRKRPAGSWWDGPKDWRTFMETEASLKCLDWLQQRGLCGRYDRYETPDPPDLLAFAEDNAIHAIEVTELCASGHLAKVKFDPDTPPDHLWTDSEVQTALNALVSNKSLKRSFYGGQPTTLCIVCDEVMILPERIALCTVPTHNFANVVVMFSYQPSYDGVGNGTYPVVALESQP